MSAHPLLEQDIMKALPKLRQAGIAGLVDDKLHPDDMPGGESLRVRSK